MLSANKQSEERQGQEQQPEPGQAGPEKAADQKFKSAECPEGDFGSEGPPGTEAATDQLFILWVVFGDGGELQPAPAGIVNLDVVFAPANVGFIRPALLVEPA